MGGISIHRCFLAVIATSMALFAAYAQSPPTTYQPVDGVTLAVWANFGMCVPRSIYTPEGDTARVEYFRKLRRAGFNAVYYFPNVVWGGYEHGIRATAGWKTEEYIMAVGPGDASGKTFAEYVAFLDEFISQNRIGALYFDEPSDQRDRWNVQEPDAPAIPGSGRKMTRLEQLINLVMKYPHHVDEVLVNGYASGAGDPNNPATADPVNAKHYGFPYPVHHFEYEQLTGLWPDGFTGSPFKTLYDSGFPVRIMDDTYHYPPQYGLPGVGDQTPLWRMEADNTRAAGATIAFSATRGDSWDPLRYPFPSDFQSYPMLFGTFLDIHQQYRTDPAHDFSMLTVYCGDMDADMVNRMRRFMVAWYAGRFHRSSQTGESAALSTNREPRAHPCDAFAVYTNPPLPAGGATQWDVSALCAADPDELAINIIHVVDGYGPDNEGFAKVWLDGHYPLLPAGDPGYTARRQERDSVLQVIHADFRENLRPQMSEFFYADFAGWLVYHSGPAGEFIRDYLCAYHGILLRIVTQAGLQTGLLQPEPAHTSVARPSTHPASIALSVYPNPIAEGESATLNYITAPAHPTSLTLYNTLGIAVYTAQPGRQIAGEHTLSIPTRGLAPGVYQCVLRSGNECAVQRLVVR